MFSNKVVSIDIGSYSTKIIVGKLQNKTVLVEKAFTFETPTGTFEDGVILDLDKIKQVINTYLNKEKINVKKAICTVESTSTITRELELPYVQSQEIDSMIRFEIEQYLPIMFDEYVVEYRLLEKFNEDEVKKIRVLVAALFKNISEKYFNLVKGLKLKPISLDIHSNAISKLFDKKTKINDENYSLDKTVAFIDLGHSYINVIIIEKGMLRFNRMIPLGGKDINISIANSYNLSFEEADINKKEHGNLELTNHALAYPTMINELIQSNVDGWIREIQRIFQYYTSRSIGNTINEIYLFGGSSNIKGLIDYMKASFNIPTFKLEKISNIKFSKNLKDTNIEQYLNAIAAIIRR